MDAMPLGNPMVRRMAALQGAACATPLSERPRGAWCIPTTLETRIQPRPTTSHRPGPITPRPATRDADPGSMSVHPLLTTPELLRLVLDLAPEDDAIFLALVCLMWRMAVFERFSKRLRTPLRTCVISEARLHWTVAHADGLRWSAFLCEQCARVGRLDWLQWLLSFPGVEYDEMDTLKIASAAGHLDIVSFVSEECGPDADIFPVICRAAATGGHLKVLYWMRHYVSRMSNNRYFELLKECAMGAGEGDQRIVAAWLEIRLEDIGGTNAQRYECFCKTMQGGACAGRVAVLDWLANKEVELFALLRHDVEKRRALADEAGHLEVLQWLSAKDLLSLHGSWLDKAARKGRLAILQWAHARGLMVHWHGVISLAAETGQTDVLRWALVGSPAEGPGLSWTRDAALLAASKGHLGALQCAHAYGREWFGADVYTTALGRARLPIVRWAYSLDLPGWEDAFAGLVKTPRSTSHDTANTPPPVILQLAVNNQWDMLEWLNEHAFDGTLRLAAFKEYTGWTPSAWTHESLGGSYFGPRPRLRRVLLSPPRVAATYS